MKKIGLILLVLLSTLMAEKITVGLAEFEPNVIFKGDTVIGYDIDVWNEIARIGGFEFDFKMYDQFDNLITDVSNGTIDAGMSGITITSEREQQFDFSYPYMRSNLAVMTKGKGLDIFGVLLLFINESWGALIFFLAYLLIFSALMYIAEYGKTSFSDNFLKGMFDGLYFVNTTTTSTGYGDKTPMTPVGKIISVVIMWIGIGIIFPFITGQMANIITTYNNTDKVASMKDLIGVKKAVVQGTTSEKLMVKENLDHFAEKNIDKCLRLLENDEVSMVIYDESMLRYIDKVGQYNIQPLLPIIQNYGIALKEDMDLKDEIDVIVLDMIESGKYKEIYDRWFSNK